MSRPLEGLLVVALEQAVAAPLCSRKLADAGARVIKLERPEGDFARGYDATVHGESSYFVWLNRGKQSVVADMTDARDRALFERLIAKADVFLQNLKPGVMAKLGYPLADLRKSFPRLICCSISGYGEHGPYAKRKAYDMLVQAESGLASITGGPEAPARVGVSVVDIATGMNAYEGILEALLARAITGTGGDIQVSLFGSMAEWMSVPLLQAEGGQPPGRVGFTHATIAPYGVFETRDGTPILISIQNDREWAVLAAKVLGRPDLVANTQFATNVARVANRAQTDALVAAHFVTRDIDTLAVALDEAEIAYGRVNDVHGLKAHPHLALTSVATPSGNVWMPAAATRHSGAVPAYGPVPALGADTDQVRREFAAGPHESRAANSDPALRPGRGRAK